MSLERSIWVIGDIHGALDPLMSLLNTIQCIEYTRSRQVTIIFLGDYIDHGPCSKEVVDTLIDLPKPFECVFLAGNHEDMLLQFLYPETGFDDYSKAWFLGNGGQSTICSFTKSPNALRRLWMRSLSTKGFPPGDFVLAPKYREFFDGLIYAHTDDVAVGQDPLRLAFTHAALYRKADSQAPPEKQDPDIPLKEQLAVRSRQDFLNMCRKHPMWLENYHIWNREMPYTAYGDFILIHGHTPTPILDVVHPDRLGDFDPDSALPFVKFPEDQHVKVTSHDGDLHFGAKLSDVISINIDTGSVYGSALTALNFSSHRMRKDSRIGVIQIHAGLTHREYECCRRFHLEFDGI